MVLPFRVLEAAEGKPLRIAGAATTFVASLPIPLEIKALVVALGSSVTGAILLYLEE